MLFVQDKHCYNPYIINIEWYVLSIFRFIFSCFTFVSSYAVIPHTLSVIFCYAFYTFILIVVLACEYLLEMRKHAFEKNIYIYQLFKINKIIVRICFVVSKLHGYCKNHTLISCVHCMDIVGTIHSSAAYIAWILLEPYTHQLSTLHGYC